MQGTLERVSVVATEVVRFTPLLAVVVAHVTLADLVQYRLA